MLAFYLSLIDNENDRKRFEKIYNAYRKQMISVAFAVLNNKYDSEDAVHEVFYRIAEKYSYILHTITDEDDMKNYLLKATKNTAINTKKKKDLNYQYQEKISSIYKEKAMTDKEFWDFLCSEISFQELVNAIRKLDEKYSEVLYLHYVLELPVPDVSKSLDRNIHTVKKQIVRGKALLVEKLTKSEVFIGND